MQIEQIIDLALINVSVVFVWLRLSIPQQLADAFIKLATKGKILHATLRKPLGCELCMCFWFSLFYLIVENYDALFGPIHEILLIFVVSILNGVLVQYNNAIIEKSKQFVIKILKL